MFETKSELRSIATKVVAVAAAISVSLSLAGCAAQPTEEQKQTLAFIETKFIDDSYVEGFTPGVADYGITMEMLLQRKAVLDNSEGFKQAIAASLEDASLSGTVQSSTGYLFNPASDTAPASIKIDLTGKYAFVSAALKAENEANRIDLLSAAEAAFASNYATTTDFAIAWLVLGLDSNGKSESAIDVAQKLVAAQDTDGGFDDFTPDSSTADATGLALQALASVKNEGTKEQKAAVEASIQKALVYLTSTMKTDHWEAYDADNTNGTAYAYMGILAAVGHTDLLTTIQDWLKTQVMADGGVQAGFAPGASDTMATSQVVTAIQGKTYLDLLNN